MANNKKGVIFDLDGVITDTAKYHFIAWKNLASSIGITLDEEFNTSLKGVSRIDSLKRILEHGNKLNDYTEDEILSLAEKKNNEYKGLLESLTKNDILPGVADFIDDLKNHGIKISLASASKNAPFILKKLGLYEKFDYIADPDKVKHGKPAPDIFIEAARGLSLPIEETVGIEDAVAGVAAMRACNMNSIGIGVDADITLHGTDELKYSLILEF